MTDKKTCIRRRTVTTPAWPERSQARPAGVLTNVKLDDGRQAVVAIQVHHLVPGGDEILDELLV